MPRIEIPQIRFVQIMPDDWLHFKELDPLDRLELMFLPGAFAIGAFDMSGDTPLDVGLMVVTLDKDRYVLEWLCTDPDHTDLEIGGAFLTMLYDQSLERGFKEVAVRLTSELKTEVEYYFREHFFEEEIQAPDLFRLEVSDFLKNVKQMSPTGTARLRAVKELAPSERNQIRDYVAGRQEKYSLTGDRINWDYINGDISFSAWDDSGKVTGVFLSMTQGINCYPLLLASDKSGIEQDLICASIEALKALEGEGYKLSILCRSSEMSELAEDITKGGGRIHQRLLVAETQRYADYVENME